MSSRKLFSIFSNSYTITFSSFDHTIPVPSSKVLNDNAEYTEVVFQTPAYAPPERSKDVDKEKAGLSEFVNQENLERYKHTRDLYSLAITIAYLITGKSCNTNRKAKYRTKNVGSREKEKNWVEKD